jgi:hypothetical protein
MCQYQRLFREIFWQDSQKVPQIFGEDTSFLIAFFS